MNHDEREMLFLVLFYLPFYSGFFRTHFFYSFDIQQNFILFQIHFTVLKSFCTIGFLGVFPIQIQCQWYTKLIKMFNARRNHTYCISISIDQMCYISIENSLIWSNVPNVCKKVRDAVILNIYTYTHTQTCNQLIYS